jgi:DNA-binding LacI/PurR family transcriptional regulator
MARLLLARIENPEAADLQHVILVPDLVVRESS